MMDLREQERFAALCRQEEMRSSDASGGIGIYNEKRLHRVCKAFSCQSGDPSCFEVKVGPYVADVLEGGQITEIQCGSFLPLREKLVYYVSEGYSVTVVRPMLADLTLIRTDRETGEILRTRRYRSYEKPIEILPLLYDLRAQIAEELFSLRLLLIRGEELRYSERMRYRREGRYDAERYPRELLETVELRSREDYRQFLPSALPPCFTAAEYGQLTGLRGRKLYSALNVLIALSLLGREKDGRQYRYCLL